MRRLVVILLFGIHLPVQAQESSTEQYYCDPSTLPYETAEIAMTAAVSFGLARNVAYGFRADDVDRYPVATSQRVGALRAAKDLGDEFHNRSVEAQVTAAALLDSEGDMQRIVDRERKRATEQNLVAHLYTIEEAYAMAEYCSGGRLS